MIIVRVIYILLLSLMPIEETGEIRVRTDFFEIGCFPLNVHKKQILVRDIEIIFLWDFRSRSSSRLHAIPS